MATVRQFEDLLCWKKARELTREIYKALRDCRDHGFKDQIQRASVSVMSNIAEGFERGTRAEFINYLFIAKGSCGEVRCQLYIALDNGYLNDETFKRLNSLSADCSVLIWRFIQSIKTANVAGLQYKKEKSKAQRDREEFDAYLQIHLEETKRNPDAPFDFEGWQRKRSLNI